MVIWDVQTGERLREFKERRDASRLQFSPDGSTLASASVDGSIRLWDVHTGEMLQSFVGHYGSVNDLVFSPNGDSLASAGTDAVIRLWNPATGERIRSLLGHTEAIRSLSFSAEGGRLAAGGDDQGVRIWQLSEEAPLPEVAQPHPGRVTDVSFSGNGETILSACYRSPVVVWSSRTGEIERTPQDWDPNRGDSPGGLCVSSDGALVATGASTRTITIWEVASGKRLRKFVGLRAPPRQLRFSSDGRWFVAADGTAVYLWNLKQLLETAEDFNRVLDYVNIDGRKVTWPYDTELRVINEASPASVVGILQRGGSPESVARQSFWRCRLGGAWPAALGLASSLGPSSPEAAEMVGRLHRMAWDAGQNNNPRMAAAYVDAAEKTFADLAWPWHIRATLHERDGNLDEALLAIDRALAFAPDNSDFCYFKARILAAGNRHEESLEWYDRALEASEANRNPRIHRHRELLLGRAGVQTRLNRLEAARRDNPDAFGIPDPPANRDGRQIDLSRFYNQALTDGVTTEVLGNDLSGLQPFGLKPLGNVIFDVRGLIQLKGRGVGYQGTSVLDRMPAQVEGIPVGATCHQIHFLHGISNGGASGERVGAYRIRYVDGTQEEFPILVGEHLWDWWFRIAHATPKSVLAWRGENDLSVSFQSRLGLYRTTWDNPRPEVSIESIDFSSAMNVSTPFLIAITLSDGYDANQFEDLLFQQDLKYMRNLGQFNPFNAKAITQSGGLPKLRVASCTTPWVWHPASGQKRSRGPRFQRWVRFLCRRRPLHRRLPEFTNRGHRVEQADSKEPETSE